MNRGTGRQFPSHRSLRTAKLDSCRDHLVLSETNDHDEAPSGVTLAAPCLGCTCQRGVLPRPIGSRKAATPGSDGNLRARLQALHLVLHSQDRDRNPKPRRSERFRNRSAWPGSHLHVLCVRFTSDAPRPEREQRSASHWLADVKPTQAFLCGSSDATPNSCSPLKTCGLFGQDRLQNGSNSLGVGGGVDLSGSQHVVGNQFALGARSPKPLGVLECVRRS